MKILVTGATGFIGNYVVLELLKRGFNVIATSTNESKAKSFSWYSKVTFVEHDINSQPSGENLYEKFHQPKALIHLAWKGLPNYTESFHVTENLPSNFLFLKELAEEGVTNITISGTCLEYGMVEGELKEDMPSAPTLTYPEAKNQLRLQLEELNKEVTFDLKWARLFYMYGKGQNPNSLLSQLDTSLEQGDKVFNMSCGDQKRDYLPVEKVAEKLVSISLQTNVFGIINCCNGNPTTVLELVKSHLEKEGKTIELNRGFYPYANYEPKHFWGNTDKLKQALNEG